LIKDYKLQLLLAADVIYVIPCRTRRSVIRVHTSEKPDQSQHDSLRMDGHPVWRTL